MAKNFRNAVAIFISCIQKWHIISVHTLSGVSNFRKGKTQQTGDRQLLWFYLLDDEFAKVDGSVKGNIGNGVGGEVTHQEFDFPVIRAVTIVTHILQSSISLWIFIYKNCI